MWRYVIQAVSRLQHQRRHSEVFDRRQRRHVPSRRAGGREFNPGQRGYTPLPLFFFSAGAVAGSVVHHPLGGRRGHSVLVFGLAAEKPTVGHNIGLKQHHSYR
ncbi:hypothetical protein NPIL_410281 [Nephila pilipes]|uniref:Uncharacterized protein n=1 Tax=Nephila pilipes TaxID=299642 RepID=A0A8X6UR08_NEPPI|nr:hypothetical protein NPIL_410281 [Nephila pilipes]